MKKMKMMKMIVDDDGGDDNDGVANGGNRSTRVYRPVKSGRDKQQQEHKSPYLGAVNASTMGSRRDNGDEKTSEGSNVDADGASGRRKNSSRSTMLIRRATQARVGAR